MQVETTTNDDRTKMAWWFWRYVGAVCEGIGLNKKDLLFTQEYQNAKNALKEFLPSNDPNFIEEQLKMYILRLIERLEEKTKQELPYSAWYNIPVVEII